MYGSVNNGHTLFSLIKRSIYTVPQFISFKRHRYTTQYPHFFKVDLLVFYIIKQTLFELDLKC